MLRSSWPSCSVHCEVAFQDIAAKSFASHLAFASAAASKQHLAIVEALVAAGSTGVQH